MATKDDFNRNADDTREVKKIYDQQNPKAWTKEEYEALKNQRSTPVVKNDMKFPNPSGSQNPEQRKEITDRETRISEIEQSAKKMGNQFRQDLKNSKGRKR
jgi:hypothetical protein